MTNRTATIAAAARNVVLEAQDHSGGPRIVGSDGCRVAQAGGALMVAWIAMQMQRHTDLHSLLESVLANGLELAGAPLGNIQLMDWQTGNLTIATQRGFKEDFLRFFRFVRADDGSACGRSDKEPKFGCNRRRVARFRICLLPTNRARSRVSRGAIHASHIEQWCLGGGFIYPFPRHAPAFRGGDEGFERTGAVSCERHYLRA
jgi:hypothetical protein